MDVYNISNLLAIIGALVVLVKILTEVIKKVTWDRLPTNIVALILSEGLTLAAGAAYAQINTIHITWYLVVGAVVVGFMVAYAAMFGYDKLKEILDWRKTNGN